MHACVFLTPTETTAANHGRLSVNDLGNSPVYDRPINVTFFVHFESVDVVWCCVSRVDRCWVE